MSLLTGTWTSFEKQNLILTSELFVNILAALKFRVKVKIETKILKVYETNSSYFQRIMNNLWLWIEYWKPPEVRYFRKSTKIWSKLNLLTGILEFKFLAKVSKIEVTKYGKFRNAAYKTEISIL
jgi:hypothetical protein